MAFIGLQSYCFFLLPTDNNITLFVLRRRKVLLLIEKTHERTAPTTTTKALRMHLYLNFFFIQFLLLFLTMMPIFSHHHITFAVRMRQTLTNISGSLSLPLASPDRDGQSYFILMNTRPFPN